MWYVAFSEDWNERLYTNQESPPDSAEFERFKDLLNSKRWRIVEEEKGIKHKVSCPIFFVGEELTCRPQSFGQNMTVAKQPPAIAE